MANFPIFLSVVIVAKNQEKQISHILKKIAQCIQSQVSDYEIIIVDNASCDETVLSLKKLTEENGQPNLQVFSLTREVSTDVGFCIGLENALGDYVAFLDPISDDIEFLPRMLASAASGADVVFAHNEHKIHQSLAYSLSVAVFHFLYKWFNGVDLATEASQFRVLSKKVVNYILRHPQHSLMYRHLPVTGGFSRANLQYNFVPHSTRAKSLLDGVDRGLQLLVSTTRAPMRLVTSFSLFGAVANLLYSIYVVAVAFLKSDVAPGWVSMSLQQSGMFFLISSVLLVLGEYILNMSSFSNQVPLYNIGMEYTSTHLTRQDRLNIEDSSNEGNELASTSSQGQVKLRSTHE